MAEVLLFHHALGLTSGCAAFADDLRAAGHVVHAPDLYDGRTFTTLDEGVAHAEAIGFDTVLERGRAVAAALPSALVYAGFSLGVMPAQLLAMTRPGARGAVLLHGFVPPAHFAPTWPADVPLQVHSMEDDEWGDVDDARTAVPGIPGAELFLYAGDRHLFTDRSLDAFDDAAAALLQQRVLEFLARVG